MTQTQTATAHATAQDLPGAARTKGCGGGTRTETDRELNQQWNHGQMYRANRPRPGTSVQSVQSDLTKEVFREAWATPSPGGGKRPVSARSSLFALGRSIGRSINAGPPVPPPLSFFLTSPAPLLHIAFRKKTRTRVPSLSGRARQVWGRAARAHPPHEPTSHTARDQYYPVGIAIGFRVRLDRGYRQ
mgnify:CR=1 FL=1